NILTPNHKLTQAAYRKAYDILNNGYFAHTNPSGKPFYQWIEEEGYNYLYAGENLAIDFITSEGLFGAWLKSPSHRANLINPNYNEIGLVTLRGHWQDHETTVVVQTFGSVLSDSPTVLGNALQNLGDDLQIRKNDLIALTSNLVFLPSLAGRKYFDVILKTDKAINLALSNPTTHAIAQIPITKVAQGDTYQTLLKKESNCCQNDIVFALTEERGGVNVTTPIHYPSLRDIITNYTLPALAIPGAPRDLTFSFMLAGVVLLLLAAAHEEEIRQVYKPSR
ncbi:MAG: CAP domain-containing protein, partial [Candidatus Komeilibacteria bacterium]|nr:CAP domain-containing protein [Candidatus Komeilibacteria bacterium]